MITGRTNLTDIRLAGVDTCVLRHIILETECFMAHIALKRYITTYITTKTHLLDKYLITSLRHNDL